MSTRLKALVVLAAGAMLITACGSSDGGDAEPSGSGSGATNEKFKVTLLTKATGGFWDAMIAGAKQYETDHPDDIELTTNACKTNDDTPCQIAQIQDAVTKGAQAIVVSPMGSRVSASSSWTTQSLVSSRMRSPRRTTSRAARQPAPTSRPS